MAQISKYATDLHILPESIEERNDIEEFLDSIDRSFLWQYSDVKGQSWYGQRFIEVPFGWGLELPGITINKDTQR